VQIFLACVASVFVGFGVLVFCPRENEERAKNAPFSRCNSLLPNLTETLATQAKIFHEITCQLNEPVLKPGTPEWQHNTKHMKQ